MDGQQLMDVATDGGYEYVDICAGVAILDGEYTIEQLEAIIKLLKRAQT